MLSENIDVGDSFHWRKSAVYTSTYIYCTTEGKNKRLDDIQRGFRGMGTEKLRFFFKITTLFQIFPNFYLTDQNLNLWCIFSSSRRGKISI